MAINTHYFVCVCMRSCVHMLYCLLLWQMALKTECRMLYWVGHDLSLLLDLSQYCQASCRTAEAPAVWGAARIRCHSLVEGGCQGPLYQGETKEPSAHTSNAKMSICPRLWLCVRKSESEGRDGGGENKPVLCVYGQGKMWSGILLGIHASLFIMVTVVYQ